MKHWRYDVCVKGQLTLKHISAMCFAMSIFINIYNNFDVVCVGDHLRSDAEYMVLQ